VGKAALIALALLAAVSPALAQKTDVIVLANGDRVNRNGYELDVLGTIAALACSQSVDRVGGAVIMPGL